MRFKQYLMFYVFKEKLEQSKTKDISLQTIRADNRSPWQTGYRLYVHASGSVITAVLNCLTLISIS